MSGKSRNIPFQGKKAGIMTEAIKVAYLFLANVDLHVVYFKLSSLRNNSAQNI